MEGNTGELEGKGVAGGCALVSAQVSQRSGTVCSMSWLGF